MEEKSVKKQNKEKKRILFIRNNNESAKDAINTSETSEEILIERKEAYLDRSTQNLLRKLLNDDNQKHEILPTYDPKLGFIYKTIESVFEEERSHEKIGEFLEQLTHLDILKKSFFDTVSTCPQCESTTITLHYHCPNCKSHHIVKTSLTEHIPCGFITERENYIDGKCPRCGDTIIENNYRDMGRWYICKKCTDRFEHPQLEIICRQCNRSFTIEESKVLEIPKYCLNTIRKNEIKQNVASLEKISNLLKELGFQVETPGVIIGQKSGMQHLFSLLARKDINDKEIIVTLDHEVAETEVQSNPLMLYIYKISELNVDLPIFIAIPKISETAHKIAQGHHILLIEGSPENQEATDRIRKEIELRLTQQSIQHPSEEQIPISEQEKKEQRKVKEYKSEIKPQLYSTISSIHQPEENTNLKPTKRLMKTLRKTLKRTRDGV